MILATFIASFGFSMAQAEKIKDKKDGEWITISGKVTSVTPNKFVLKPQGQSITVEMNNLDWVTDGYKIIEGDQVVVNGFVDKRFLDKKTIDASSVYVKGLGTYFYNNPTVEIVTPLIPTLYMGLKDFPEGASADLHGVVSSIHGREFELNTGFRKITIDTKSMAFNPLDDKGYLKVKVGERVRVSGKVDNNFLEGKEVDANYIVHVL
jgi:uncharacterized protein YdeI (BOF family)